MESGSGAKDLNFWKEKQDKSVVELLLLRRWKVQLMNWCCTEIKVSLGINCMMLGDLEQLLRITVAQQ